MLRADTDILSTDGCSLVGLGLVLLQAGVPIKETSTATTECRAFYALLVIGAFVLHTRWTMIWVVVARVLTFIIIGF